MMSTEHDFRKGSKQYIALRDYLKSVDRGVTPWLIFAGHRSELANCLLSLILSPSIPISGLIISY